MLPLSQVAGSHWFWLLFPPFFSSHFFLSAITKRSEGNEKHLRFCNYPCKQEKAVVFSLLYICVYTLSTWHCIDIVVDPSFTKCIYNKIPAIEQRKLCLDWQYMIYLTMKRLSVIYLTMKRLSMKFLVVFARFLSNRCSVFMYFLAFITLSVD